MLTVSVYSFSYFNGHPSDTSGNGGGFVFDCRALHNPGRYEEYKRDCGLDQNVIEFLDREEGVASFLAAAMQLVSQSVDVYIQRDFIHLMVSFGCTGGQHRSVYCAQHFADALRVKYPQIQVRIIHSEQQNWPKK